MAIASLGGVPQSLPFHRAVARGGRDAYLLARYPGQGKSRSFAKSTLSGRARFFASLRMTEKGLRMTANGLRRTVWGERRSTGCPIPP